MTRLLLSHVTLPSQQDFPRASPRVQLQPSVDAMLMGPLSFRRKLQPPIHLPQRWRLQRKNILAGDSTSQKRIRPDGDRNRPPCRIRASRRLFCELLHDISSFCIPCTAHLQFLKRAAHSCRSLFHDEAVQRNRSY